MFILMDKYKMFQIDDVIDFKIVEMLMKKFKNNEILSNSIQ